MATLMGYVQGALENTMVGTIEKEHMDAVDMLIDDHRKVEELFKQVEATDSVAKHKQLFKKIKMELDIHAHIEEKIFYPRIKKEEEVKDITLEGIEEHHQAKMFLREIPALADGSEKFDPKLKVLIEDIRHHVKEEEREMFPKVRDLLSGEELMMLGAEMDAEKKRMKKTMKAPTN